MKHYKEYTQQELDEIFRDTIDWGNAFYRNFEITFEEHYNYPELSDTQFENLKDYKKMVEGQFIDHIQTKVGIKAIVKDVQKYDFPITEENFEFNINNILAYFKLQLHNKINTKRKYNG